MASTELNQAEIDLVKTSQVPVPWCAEFEKMISSMNFTAKSSELMMAAKMEVMRNLKFFNEPTYDLSRLEQMIHYIFGKIGENCFVEQNLFVIWGCNIFIGDHVRIDAAVSIYDNATVQIGGSTYIGPDTCICTATHDIDHKVRAAGWGTSFAKPIVIKENCWIGTSVTILAGVTIGRGAVVLSSSVVAKDVEPESTVGGVPAKPVLDFGDSDAAPVPVFPHDPMNVKTPTYNRPVEQLPFRRGEPSQVAKKANVDKVYKPI